MRAVPISWILAHCVHFAVPCSNVFIPATSNIATSSLTISFRIFNSFSFSSASIVSTGKPHLSLHLCSVKSCSRDRGGISPKPVAPICHAPVCQCLFEAPPILSSAHRGSSLPGLHCPGIRNRAGNLFITVHVYKTRNIKPLALRP